MQQLSGGVPHGTPLFRAGERRPWPRSEERLAHQRQALLRHLGEPGVYSTGPGPGPGPGDVDSDGYATDEDEVPEIALVAEIDLEKIIARHDPDA
ncbi:hypothetical protein [Streptomyces chartreusis]